MPLAISEGLTDDRVLQRGDGDKAHVTVLGTAPHDVSGPVVVSVLRKEAALPEWDARNVGQAEGGTWTATLKGLPVGGPYLLTFAVANHPETSVTVRGVLVGDLWILAGQSNMEGVGDLVDVEPPSPFVHVLDMAGRWHIAEEPLHWLGDSPDSAHSELTGEAQQRAMKEARQTRTKGTGLGLSFANAYYAATGVPVGLLACAHGGTSMQQWNPELKAQGGGSLYGSMLRSVQLAGGTVRGLLWYQGESDANPDDVKRFRERFKALVANVREDVKDPNLPFYTVQLGRFVLIEAPAPDAWNGIQELQRVLPDEIPNTAVVPAIDLELDDPIHIGTQGLRRLGKRLARVAQHGLQEGSDPLPGIRLRSVTIEGTDPKIVRVSYDGVAEPGFAPSRHVFGFSLHNAEGKMFDIIYKAMVDPQNPSDVLLYLTPPSWWESVPEPQGLFLHYGHGFAPICSLVDAQDMPAPVFGPFPL